MKSVIFHKEGNWEKVLQIEEQMSTPPLSGQIQVKVTARPLNPSDRLFINGTYRKQPVFPQIAGLEGAGIIISVGENVDETLIGKQVAFRSQGTWVEEMNLNAGEYMIIPEAIAPEIACQLSLNALTAYALLSETSLRENEWVLLNAASGAVGRAFVQLAAMRSVNVISVVRNEEDISKLQTLGANYFIRSEENLIQQVNMISPAGVNAAIDAIGGAIASDTYKILAPFGKLIVYGRLSNDRVQYDNGDIIYKNLTIKGFGIDAWLRGQTQQQINAAWEFIINAVSTNALKVDFDEKYSLVNWQEAIRKYESTGKKIILV